MNETPFAAYGAAARTLPVAPREVRRSGRGILRRAVAPLALAAGDVAAAQLGLLVAGGAAMFVEPDAMLDGTLWSNSMVLATALSVLVLEAGSGLYETTGLSPFERFRLRARVALWLPWLLLAVLASTAPPTAALAAGVVVLALVYLLGSLLAEAGLRRALIARGAWGTEVVLIGPAEAAQRIDTSLKATPEIGFHPVRYCGELAATDGAMPGAQPGQAAVFEAASRLADIAVVILPPGSGPLDLSTLPFRRVVVVPEIAGMPALLGRFCAVGGGAAIDFANVRTYGSGRLAKRALDLLVAVPLLAFTLPVILLTALAISLVSPGWPFFVQRRVGLHGRVIPILKLRSMHVDAERRLAELLEHDPVARREWDLYMKLARDPRVIPVLGNFIRRTSIDELPQLWNVVRGDISVVGPRPFPAYHIARFPQDFQGLRCSVPPGLTGLWQVSERSNADLRQQEAIDTFYIRNWSLWLDIYILLRTVPAVLSARGAK